MPRIGTAQREELTEVRSFYADVGYPGRVEPSDTVLVARSAADIVGAVRLCMEEGCLVLRGMYVDAARRGSGIGTELLAAVSTLIGGRGCWCIPYSRLRTFYARAGFMEVPRASVPTFLADRGDRYLAKGEAVIFTERPANWSR